ncbi:Dolichyl-P-Man:Man(5)GlcNAc(2)-PP-dolichyl mannosyltransferase [Taphrina deformans PYCC 5710]|uniref:Dol-P-Man:Man(5)GlcNAc(2)-PP-Dol alpha-1,3-mannosyltransferase n=1 Tax=Taphrina deformans (strain PYCC 5710 / ATCC 11124 / CBS 356.35 / IMI 108563 / JCM 9778 / NBRC 8474) TaxID=1097556 RepID=R4X949_TAPDE|nr:Dolichyl-P-Man:Man(5)GlcNAc(2)-PP-dolichyl mannosyltransferase [Taphrina deformans PYCC 5710]|eukprot:CCG82183.1 Dolichyl-P-Man:Man(5)GlcNAc(2)-PP-dolichyl mannosyltransferase [Taphrina deformans PYCC 5710]
MISTRKASYGLLALDAILCALIILRVNYTEIDWTAYMQQVAQFLGGERDYGLIKGQTGPLVYPAGHVYLYSLLYYVTEGGRSIVTAQVIFAGLYLGTIGVTMATYRRVRAPLYIFPLLVLSKRMHSIFLLRLFNDGISAFLSAAMTYCFVRKWYLAATLLFTLSLSVKMNALLFFPGIVMILVQGGGVLSAVRHVVLIVQVQLVLALPFLLHDPRQYISRAFDLGRVFEYRWTVNWRFIDEPTFRSREFAAVLMAGHLATLLVFAGTRWNRPSRRSLVALAVTSVQTTLGVLFPTGRDRPMAEMTPAFILTTLSSANLIGILFARSAHYQFYAWFACSVPYLLHRSGLPVPLQLGLWTAQEVAWNVYPSTNASSAVVVAVPLVTLLAVWISSAKDVVGVVVTEESHNEAQKRQARRARQLKQVRAGK